MDVYPEEWAHQKISQKNINRCEKEEQRIFKNVKNFVCVSEQMVNFYKINILKLKC